MTDISGFNDEELAQILDAPRAVMEGAIAADGSKNSLAFLKELTAGAKVFREGQQHENEFVKAVAAAIRERDMPKSEGHNLREPQIAVSKALTETEQAIALLRGRADQGDVDAYGEWLIRLATQIAKAAKSKEAGFFSKKVPINEAEQAFIEDLKASVAR